MSLITDVTLMRLWEEAQVQSSNEVASATLWSHLWSKHLFPEEGWAVLHERPYDGSGRRRVGISIQCLGGDKKLAMRAFHVAKAPNAGPQDVEEAEQQAFDACMSYLGERPDLQFVYAFTSFGTKGRAWQCAQGDHSLSPLCGSEDLSEPTQYIEVHSSEAQLIREAVEMWRVASPRR